MHENGNANGVKSKLERDEKGRFLPGGPGGPGRGKRSDEIDLDGLDFWEGSKQLILQNMSSRNENTSLKATALYLKWRAMKEASESKGDSESKVDSITAPDVLELFIFKRLSQQLGGTEGLEKMLEVCPGCHKFPGEPLMQFNPPDEEDAG